MPPFNSTAELGACVEDAVVVFLVVDGSRDAISEHAFGKTWKRVYGVLAQEDGGARRVFL